MTADEPAYLIIGVGDKPDEIGSKPIIGITDEISTAEDILKLIGPYIHETVRKLEPPSQQYSPYVVFIRRNSCFELATYKERKAIEQLKAIRLSEQKNAPPVFLGALVGSLIL